MRPCLPRVRAEVPLIGNVKTLRGTFTVSGQGRPPYGFSARTLIVDFKTNRVGRRRDAGLMSQLAPYRALSAETGRIGAHFALTARRGSWKFLQKPLDNSMPTPAGIFDLKPPVPSLESWAAPNLDRPAVFSEKPT